MKQLIYIVVFLLSGIVYAKPSSDAKKVLDATASKIERSGNIKVGFTITTFTGTTETGSTSGTMSISGKKFCMSTSDIITWFNGTTEWTYIRGSEEVNVTTPTAQELQQMNPYAFITMYKKGFNYRMDKGTLRGKAVYTIHLTPQKKGQDIQEMVIDVTQKDYTPLCIRIKEKGNWTRISLNSFAGGQKFKDSDFTFQKSDYPDVDVIDLR